MAKSNLIQNSISILMSAMALVGPLSAEAQSNSGITYHGRITKPDGSALSGQLVQFKMQIRSPGNENCLLYEEVQTKNLSTTNGAFSITINDGTGSRGDDYYLPGLRYTLDRVFQNRVPFSPSASCEIGSSYAPNIADGRRFTVLFKDETMTSWEEAPSSQINFVPFALDSKSVGGFSPSQLLRLDDAAATLNSAPLTSTQVTNLLALMNGTSSLYTKQSSSGGVSLPSYSAAAPPSAAAAGSIWYDSTDGKLKYHNGVSAVTLDSGSSSTLPAVGTAGTYTKVTTDAEGRVVTGDTLDESDVPQLTTANKVSGSAITSGDISTTGSFTTSGAVSAAGAVSGSYFSGRAVHVSEFSGTNTNYIQLRTPSAASGFNAGYVLTLPLNDGDANQILSTNGSGVLSWVDQTLAGIAVSTTSLTANQFLKYNGTSWVNSAIAMSDVTGLSTQLGNKLDISSMTGSCTAAQTLTFAAPTDTWTCTDISLPAGQLTGTISALRLPASIVDGAWTAASGSVHRASGNVGVGTTSPTTLIDAWGTSAPIVRVTASSGTATFSANSYGGSVPANSADINLTRWRGSLGAPAVPDQGDVLGSINAYGGGNPSNYTPLLSSKIQFNADETFGAAKSGGNISFHTQPMAATGTMQERLRINSSGNVGIGTTAPAARLHVIGSSAIGSAQFTPPALPWDNSGATSYSTQTLTTYGGGASGGIGIVTDNASIAGNAPTISFARSLGTIAAPTAVASGQHVMTLIGSGHDGTNYQRAAEIHAAVDGSAAAGSVPGRIVFSTSSSGSANPAERMRISSNGNVGIGTTSSADRLSVVQATNADAILSLTNTTAGYGSSINITANSDWAALTIYGANQVWKMGQDGSTKFSITDVTTDLTPFFIAPGAPADSLMIASSGRVGIGTSSPGERLQVNGNIRAVSTYSCTLGNASGSVSCSSDARLKENVLPIEAALDKVLQLRGVEFDWNKKSNAFGHHDIGVIAQEVEAVFPSVVKVSPETGYKMVDYGSLVSPLIQALKEFHAKWLDDSSSLHREVASLRAENAELRSENAAIKDYLCARDPGAGICE